MLTNEQIKSEWAKFTMPALSEWQRAYFNLVKKVKAISDDGLRWEAYRPVLWMRPDLSPYGSGGPPPKHLDAFIALRNRKWPTDPELRAKEIQFEFNRLLKNGSLRKLDRAFLVLLPGELCCTFADESYEGPCDPGRLLLEHEVIETEDWGETTHIERQVLIRARLREVLGKETNDEEHIKRAVFCSALIETFGLEDDDDEGDDFDSDAGDDVDDGSDVESDVEQHTPPPTSITKNLEVRLESGVLGLHRISVRLLSMQAGPHEITLMVPERPDLRVSIQDGPTHRFQDNKLWVPTQEIWTEVFFSIHGTFQGLASLAVTASGANPYPIEARFRVMPAVLPAPPIVAPASSWLLSLPEEVRPVFAHLEAHESITEEEVVRILGKPLLLRRFSSQLEEYTAHAPFSVKIEPTPNGKRYFKEKVR